MRDDRELATAVARDIFKTFDNPGDVCQRIQGKGGDWHEGKETDLGGMCEEALVHVIEKSLSRYRTY